jgi:hypothetical protein
VTGNWLHRYQYSRDHPADLPGRQRAGHSLGARLTESSVGRFASNEDNQLNARPSVHRRRRRHGQHQAEHKFTDRWSLSALYIYNKTDEPGRTIRSRRTGHIASQDNTWLARWRNAWRWPTTPTS